MCKYSKHLTMKDVLWRGLLKFDVPHKGNTIWFMRGIFIVVVGGNQQLRVLRGEKQSKHHKGSADPKCLGNSSEAQTSVGLT